MKVQIVEHIEYSNEVVRRTVELPDDLNPTQVWQGIYKETIGHGLEDTPNTACEQGYLEDWTACGTHHKGVIARVWWGEDAEKKANSKYEEIKKAGAQGVVTSHEDKQ